MFHNILYKQVKLRTNISIAARDLIIGVSLISKKKNNHFLKDFNCFIPFLNYFNGETLNAHFECKLIY